MCSDQMRVQNISSSDDNQKWWTNILKLFLGSLRPMIQLLFYVEKKGGGVLENIEQI